MKYEDIEPTKVYSVTVGVEAMRYDGSFDSQRAIHNWMTREALKPGNPFSIWGEDDKLRTSPGSWVVKGVRGEFFDCSHEVFMQTYVVVGESAG